MRYKRLCAWFHHVQSRACLAFCLLLIAALVPARGYAQFSCTPSSTMAVWGLGASGDWNVANNWSPGGVPNSTSTGACILDGISTVSLTNLSPTVDSLTLNTGNGLNIESGTALTLSTGNPGDAGIIQNAGTITLNSGGSLVTQQYSNSLSGGGAITMTGGTLGSASLSNMVTLNDVDNTIQGYGSIGNPGTGGFTLQIGTSGQLLANVSGQTFTYLGTGLTDIVNNGLVEATNGGSLTLQTLGNAGTVLAENGGTIAAGSGGIFAEGAGSLIEAGNGGTVTVGGQFGTFVDGTINITANGGNVTLGSVFGPATINFTTENSGSILMDGAETLGAMNLTSGSTLNVSGGVATLNNLGLTNAGTIVLSSGEIAFNSPVIQPLTGGGIINLLSGTIAVDLPTPSLTNANNTIRGTGAIEVSPNAVFTNNGTVDAQVSGGTLTIGGGGSVINQGLLEATTGGILALSTEITNNGTVDINASTLTVTGDFGANNGTLTIENGSTGTITGTLSNNGAFNVNSSNAALGNLDNGSAGSVQVNSGNLTLNSSSLPAGSTIDVTNAGTISLTSSSLLFNDGGNEDVFYFNTSGSSGNINLNGSNIEAVGGTAQMQSYTNITNTAGSSLMNLDMTNNAAMNVNAGTLTLRPTGMSSSPGIANLGSMTVSNGATLVWDMSQYAGTSPSTPAFSNAGTVTVNGTLQWNNAPFSGAFINNSGTINVNNGAALGSSSAGVVALSGGGTITLAGGTFGGYAGSNWENADNTIQGYGGIGGANGSGSFTLTNESNGTILANVSGQTLGVSGTGNTLDNSGLIEATTGGTLTFQNLDIEPGGLVIATNGGTVSAVGSTIVGSGTAPQLEAENGGTIILGSLTGNTSLTDANVLANGGLVQVGNVGSGSPASATFTSENGGTITASGVGSWSALTITSGSTFNMNGADEVVETDLQNSGTIAVNNGSALVFSTNSGIPLQGGGAITMNSGTFLVESGATLTNADNTLQGTGTLDVENGSSFTNNATVEANGGTLFLVSAGLGGTITNNGTFTATAGSLLHIQSSVNLTNWDGAGTLNGGTYIANGTIQIDALGSTGGEILTNDANIILDGSNGGAALISDSAGNNALTSLSLNNGSLTLQNGGNANLTVSANLTNAGTLTVGSGSTFSSIGNYTNTGSSAVLSGGTFSETGTLSGAGTFTNGGTLQAGAGSTMDLMSSVANNGGTILASGAGTEVLLDGATISGGTLTTASGGTMIGENNAVLDGSTNAVTISSGSTLQVNDGQTLDATGTITNNGTLSLNSAGSSTELLLTGNTSLSGSGLLILSNNANNVVTASAASDVLTNAGTIQGSGVIGNSLTLSNSGTIDANQSAPLTINPSGGITNTGMIEATGGTLALANTTVANSGGTISANGETLQVNNATINGGAVTLTGAATLQLSSGVIQNGSTLTNSSAGIVDAVAGSSTLSGTTTNPGMIEATGGATLDFQGSVTNSGGTILATGTGSQVLLDGLQVSGGTLTSSSGGVLVAENTAALTGAVTLSAGSTLQVNDGQTLQLNGTLTNNGAASLNSSGSNTELLLTASSTLAGTGTLTLSGNAGNLITAAAGTDVLTNSETIQGSGNIGGGNMGLVNGSGGMIKANQSTPLILDTSSQGFNNKGTLSVGAGDTLEIVGPFTNFSSGRLTGGTYSVTGILDLPSGDNITTNAAAITLAGAAAEIENPAGSGSNALSALASNASTGRFKVTGGQVLTDSATAVRNAGILTVGKNSKLTLSAATGTYRQSAGTTTVDGTLTADGGITFNGGSVFGNGGTLSVGSGTVTDNATLNIGDTTMTAGRETISGKYSQSSSGALDIDIGGTTGGTQYDRLTVSGAASLNGTLNLALIDGFVPTLTETFDILNASSVSGTFATVNGTSINSNEHFGVVYNTNNVTLDVLSGPSGAGAWGGEPESLASSGEFGAGSRNGSPINSSSTPEPGSLILLGSGLFGLGWYARRKMKGSKP